MNAFNQVFKTLDNGQQKYKNIVTTAYNPLIEATKSLFIRDPGAFGSLDPGSLYGQWKQDPNQTAQNAMMGMVTPIKTTPRALGMISDKDRNIMGAFAQLIEQGKTKGNLGQVGQDAQRIVEGMNIPSTSSNNAIAKYFNAIVKAMDERGIRPVKE